jgi:Fic family protein
MILRAPELPPPYLQVIGRINEMREKLRFATSDSLHRWNRLLARTSAARALVGTNALEGVNVTQDDAVAVIDGEPPLTAQDEDRFAIVNYWNAMTYIVQLAKDKTYVHNEHTIKSLHYMMLSHDLSVHPGRWRPGPIHITNIPTNTIVYEGPDVALVPGLMADLVEFLNKPSEQPLIKAAMAHLNLTMIHPFSDGNGRMARAMQTMVLSREGILDPHFSSIEEYIGRHSLEYYDVLAKVGQGSWHPEHDALPWIRFCLTSHYRQAADLLRRMTDMGQLWQALDAEAKRLKFNERVVNALADAALGYKVRNPTYRKQADVTNQVAKYDLKNLADAGLLVPVGERKGRYYTAGPLVQELRQKTRSPRQEPDPFTTQDIADALTESKQQPSLPGFEAATGRL